VHGAELKIVILNSSAPPNARLQPFSLTKRAALTPAGAAGWSAKTKATMASTIGTARGSNAGVVDDPWQPRVVAAPVASMVWLFLADRGDWA